MSSDVTPRSPKPRRVALLLCAAAIVAVGLAAFGIHDRARSMDEVKAWTDAQAVPTVKLVQPQRGPGEEQLTLPGTVSAFSAASLYPRATGYVTAWYKDLGAKVKKGDLLVEISAPDLDQQLVEAQAQLVQLNAGVEQAKANADLGAATNQRTTRLVAQGWSSGAQGDTDRFTAASRTAGLAVAKANLMAQQAAVGRLEELARFKQVTAPFDGIVTARAVDLGDLVNAGGTTGRALYQIADVHRMRIYVHVPQAFFGAIKPGLKATLTIPGRETDVTAEVVSTSGSLSEASRMALVELQADNADGKLWPGAFTEVQFHLPSDANTLRVPATALVFGKDGMRVAALGADDKVALRPVVLGRNFGASVEVRSGLTLADRLVDNPLESLQTGDVVQVAGTPAKAKPATVAAAERTAPQKATSSD